MVGAAGVRNKAVVQEEQLRPARNVLGTTTYLPFYPVCGNKHRLLGAPGSPRPSSASSRTTASRSGARSAAGSLPTTFLRQKSEKSAAVGTGAKPRTTGTSSCGNNVAVREKRQWWWCWEAGLVAKLPAAKLPHGWQRADKQPASRCLPRYRPPTRCRSCLAAKSGSASGEACGCWVFGVRMCGADSRSCRASQPVSQAPLGSTTTVPWKGQKLRGRLSQKEAMRTARRGERQGGSGSTP